MSEVVTASTVSDYGFRRYVDVLASTPTSMSFLGCCDDSESVLSDAEADNNNFERSQSEGYEVVYNWEAFQIVMSGDFEPSEEVDFSDCETATDCVLKEARASVGETFDEGWEEARGVTLQSLQALIDYMSEHYEDVDDYSFVATHHIPFGDSGAKQVASVVDDDLGELTEYRLNGHVYLEYTPDDIRAATISVKFDPSLFYDEDEE